MRRIKSKSRERSREPAKRSPPFPRRWGFNFRLKKHHHHTRLASDLLTQPPLDPRFRVDFPSPRGLPLVNRVAPQIGDSRVETGSRARSEPRIPCRYLPLSYNKIIVALDHCAARLALIDHFWALTRPINSAAGHTRADFVPGCCKGRETKARGEKEERRREK